MKVALFFGFSGLALIAYAVDHMTQAARDAIFNFMQGTCPALTIVLIVALAVTYWKNN